MRLLVIRTSAMGDVALTTPVLAGFSSQYPDAEIVLLTRKCFEPFFSSIPRIKFFFPDFKARHKGIAGIFRLYRDVVRFEKIDHVIDLHDVMRSQVFRFLFMLSGVPSSVIDKGRNEKRSLVTGKKKVFLKHSVERYCDVFRKAGFPVKPEKGKCIIPSDGLLIKGTFLDPASGLNIGVAPFAKHKLKMWPEEYMVKLLGLISAGNKCRFLLFGGREDSARLEAFQKKVPGSVSIAGKLDLAAELALISRLDLMIAMDSSNMHLAALVGTKVISIWGGTDPMAGFGAWMQPDSYSIRVPVEELDCRPCTIYGKGNTRRDFECMKRLTPEVVFERMNSLKVLIH